MRTKSRIGFVHTVTGLAAFALPVSAVLAEQNGGELEEIVVTAQKREEPLSKVPMSVMAVTQEQLDNQGLKDIEDLARTVPGLAITPNGTFDEPNISLRGIQSSVGAATTGVYVNDTPIQGRYICFYCGFNAYPQLFDLERVEVLRGPQGTLFGAGSEGGTLRFITPSPSLTDYSGFVRGELATTEKGALTHEVGVAGGGPLVQDKLGFRGSLWTRDEGGYIDRVSASTGQVLQKDMNNTKSYVGRLAFNYAPVENLHIQPSVFYQRSKKDGRNLYWENGQELTSNNPLAEPVDDRQVLSSLDVGYDLPAFTIKSITSYYDRKQERTDDYSISTPAFYQGGPYVVPGLPDFTDASYITTTQKNWTQELRFASASDPAAHLSWVGGLYYSRNRIQFDQAIQPSDFEAFTQALFGLSVLDTFGTGMAGPNGEYSYVEHTANIDKELAGFGDVTYRFDNGLKLTGGVRVARSEFEFDLNQEGPEAGPEPIHTRGTQKETPFTPKLSAAYEFGDNMVYGTAAKGYRVGGANTSVAVHSFCAPDLEALGFEDVPGTYDSDSVVSYEIGGKSRLFGNRAQLSASVYLINWKDIQSNVVLGCGYNYVANLGKAVSRGFDMQGQMRVTDGLTLSGTVGYNDAYYTETVEPNGLGTRLVQDGQALPAPKWTGTLGAQYDWMERAYGTPFARIDYQYAASYERSPPVGVSGYDPDTSHVDALNYFALRAGLTRGKTNVAVFVNNVFNAQPVLLRTQDLAGENLFRDATLRPRTIGVSASYKF